MGNSLKKAFRDKINKRGAALGILEKLPVEKKDIYAESALTKAQSFEKYGDNFFVKLRADVLGSDNLTGV